MITQTVESLKQFIAIHHNDLQHQPVAKTSLFSDYVTYCNDQGYEHHTNLIQFCRAIRGNEPVLN